MLVSYKPPFKKFVKKQTRSFQLVIEDEVEAVIQNPLTGEGKKGDLTGFRVHKFSYREQKFLLSYVIQTGEIRFYTVGPHENFYRELKKYLKEVD
ncbi:MAG: type II toxin-antitoxin system RelE/ParE family toxin [Deltaproteobacteria bacterium]|nr:type II toxin-antitoxin system RelE/ParE family toxin [Deltaproteobacteria bacterium]